MPRPAEQPGGSLAVGADLGVEEPPCGDEVWPWPVALDAPAPEPRQGFQEALAAQVAALQQLLLREHKEELKALRAENEQLRAQVSAKDIVHLGKVPPKDVVTSSHPPASPHGAQGSLTPALHKWRTMFETLQEHMASSASLKTRAFWNYVETPMELHPFWTVTRTKYSSAKFSLAAAHSNELSQAGDVLTDRTSRFVRHPQGRTRVLWGLLGMVFLAYDALVIPLQIFELGVLSQVLRLMTVVTAVYWILDMPLSCLFGFQYENGLIEMRVSKISWRYFVAQFPFDVTLVLIDGLLFAVENEIGFADRGDAAGVLQASRSLRLARLLRLLRLVRLLRVRKMSETFSVIINRLKSIYTILVLRLVNHLFCILLVNHYIACIWCALADYADEGVYTWVDAYGVSEASFGYRYLISLHWSLTQFAPATNNVAPQNGVERIFAICVVLFALVAFSSFVSSVTNTVNQARTILKDTMLEEANIRQYMFERGISTELFGRTQHFFKENYARRKMRLLEADIKFFAEVPESLRIRMHEEIYMPVLLTNCMFEVASQADRQLLVRVCHTALSELSLVAGKDIFIDGTEARATFYLRDGAFIYRSLCIPSGQCQVSSDTWMSEMPLWVNWAHRGQFGTTKSSELICVDCQVFGEVFQKGGCTLLKYWSRLAIFVVAWGESLQDEGRPLTDLPMPQDTLEGLCLRAQKMTVVEKQSEIKDVFRKALSQE